MFSALFIGGIVALFLLSGNSEPKPMECITPRKSASVVTYWNDCEYTVNAYYCKGSNAGELFGRGPDCQHKAITGGGVMTTLYLASKDSGVLAAAASGTIGGIMACKAPKRPRKSSSSEFVCE